MLIKAGCGSLFHLLNGVDKKLGIQTQNYKDRRGFCVQENGEYQPEFLKKHGIKGLILDVDNTLTTHDNPVPAEGIGMARQMKKTA